MDWIRGHPIGHGSSATVSLGKAHRSSEVFAVKSIDLSKSEILQREQRILSSISCSQIVRYMGCDVTNENGVLMYNLFMEYVAGGALSDQIRNEGGKLEESIIGSHTRDILNGLDYLHMNGLVHCDIKGGNILIGKEGAKIGDLGCAKWVDDKVKMKVSISGTPVFMAPEVARGEEQSFPADIWALGCTIIEMATGSPPWKDARDPVSALYRIGLSEELPEIPSFLSDQAKDFLSKCLVREHKERWSTSQLLKHPFLEDPNSQLKQNQKSLYNSPTSILDHGFWDSTEESDTPRNLTNIGCSSSGEEKLRRISSPTRPNWALEEDWITIRSHNTNEDGDFSRDRRSTSGSEMELCESRVSEMDLISYSISKIRSNSCRNDCFVEVCKSVDLNFETQGEFISLNQNLF